MATGYLLNLDTGAAGPSVGDGISASSTLTFDPMSYSPVAGAYVTYASAGDVEGVVYFVSGNWYFVPNQAYDVPAGEAGTISVTQTPQMLTAAGNNYTGTAGNDLIYGGMINSPTGTGNDTINGGTGDDQIIYGDGNDSVSGGDGNDVIGSFDSALTGTNTLSGDAGDDRIFGGDGSDVIYGGTEADMLTGAGGNDTLYGGEGADTFFVTDDHDTDQLIGGETGTDEDWIYFGNDDTALGVTVTFTGDEAGTYDFDGTIAAGSFSEIEGIGGTAYDDNINAAVSTVDQSLFGYDGNDTLTSGAGDDWIGGGQGDDSIQAGAGADTIDGGAGNDTIHADRSVANLVSNGSLADATGWTVTGSAGVGIDGGRFLHEANSASSTLTWNSALTGLADGPGSNGAAQVVFDLAWSDGSPASSSGFGTFEMRIGGVAYIRITSPNNDGTQATVTYLNGATGPSSTLSEGNAIAATGYQSITVNLPSGVANTGTLSFVAATGSSTDDFSVDNVQVLTYAETGSGADSIDGGAGDDVIWFGTGDDTVLGGDGADYIDDRSTVQLSGDNLLDSGAGNDTIWAGRGADTLLGGTGADWLGGEDDADRFVLATGFGADTIYGGEGVSTGTDSDTLDATAISAGITVVYSGAEAGTLTDGTDSATFSEIERLELGAGNDSVDGSAATGGITVDAGAGDDTITGGIGHDSLTGGAGYDLFTFEDGFGNDTVYGGGIVGEENEDTLDFSAVTGGAITAVFTASEDGTVSQGANSVSFDNIERIIGTGLADMVDARLDASGLEIFAGAGVDTVLGGSGADLIDAGSGTDSVDAGAGDDTLIAGSGADTLTGGSGADLFVAGAGDRILDFDVVTGTGNGNALDNDRIDLSSVYNDTTLAAWNAANPGQTYGNALGWLRADQADGVLDQAGGLRLQSGGTGVDAGSLTAENTMVVCFTRGTRIVTRAGALPIETLSPGDLVLTMDGGFKPIRWIGHRVVDAALLAAFPKLRPIRVAQGALGQGLPMRDLVVSPQHRLLVASPLVAQMFGTREVLIAARHLTGLPGIAEDASAETVDYWHILFDRHEVIFAEGAPAESLYTGPEALKALEPAARAEILTLFPELAAEAGLAEPARPLIKGNLGRRLAKSHARRALPLARCT